MAKYLIGVDLHKTVVQVCVLDAQGTLQQEWRHLLPDNASGQALLGRLAQFGPDARIAVEAMGCNRWFVNGLQALGIEVIVVHPGVLKLKQAGKKTDRRDAYEIARRLYLGDVDRHARSHYVSEEAHGKRKLLRVRQAQMRRRQQTVNQIRSLLNAYLLFPPSDDLRTKKGRRWLATVELATPALTSCLRTLATDLESLIEQIRLLDEQIEQMATEATTAPLADHLPLIAALTTCTLVHEMGDARRFHRSRQVVAYVGLCPRVSQSGEGQAHHGRMTKRGNPHLRWILGQWAVRLLAKDERVREWSQRYRRLPKNKLRMALARRLLIGVWKVLSTGEAFSMEKCLHLPAAA